MASSLHVGSLLLYPTRARTEADRRAQRHILYGIKQAQAGVIEQDVARLCALSPGLALSQLLHDAGILVPVPRSSRRRLDQLWVPELIAQAMHELGIGDGVDVLLERAHAVRRSSGVTSSGDRPTVREHMDSFEITKPLLGPKKVTLVDDVVTIGRTLTASALRLQEAYPGVTVQAFALARSVRWTSLERSKDIVWPLVDVYRYTPESEWIDHGPPR